MNNFYCRNCGKKGHKYKECHNPRLSYGIILFNDKKQIIMIERKDSISFIEFIRGKYKPGNNEYIQLLFNRMSNLEKERIKTSTFKELWDNLWYNYNENKKDYNKSFEKYIKLDLDYFIKNSTNKYIYNEWEIPKGRRNLNETNKVCAIREFKEETNIDFNDYELYDNILPLEEQYTGSNKIIYKNVYYVGKIKNSLKDIKIDSDNEDQKSEVKTIKWLSYEDCLRHVRDYSDYKINIIKQIFKFINSDNNIFL
uniref:Nudix hydrolase domain-containing protein n=1 Tax=viral metagenome TaxID=1070528 RepID=A0A6C0C639_9ZZZZ